MRSVDLPIGTHVAYDAYNARSYHNFVEAYVIAHRPKGNKHNYWGSNNGNNNTVGVMYQRNYIGIDSSSIYFAWVRPASIHMLWDEYQETEAVDAKRKAERDAADSKDRADRTARLAVLPLDVLMVLDLQAGGWRRRDLIDTGSTNISMSLVKLEAIVRAAQEAIPERRERKVASEVESALRLLA